jgi:hypothetical protein
MSTLWSTVKDCRCGSSSTQPKSRIATGPAWSSTRSVDPLLDLIWADGGYNNPWQVDAAVAKVRRLRLEIVKRSDDKMASSFCRAAEWSSAPSRASGATGDQGFREPRRNSRYLCHQRFNPAHPQAACQGVGREFQKSLADSAQ